MAEPMPAPEQNEDPEPASAPPKPGGGQKSPAELLSDINMGLMQFAELNLDPDAKQELGNIIQQFQSFAEGLSGAPDKKSGALPAAPSGNMPVNGGPGTAPAF